MQTKSKDKQDNDERSVYINYNEKNTAYQSEYRKQKFYTIMN